MKILFINVVCKKGSTGKIVYDLHTYMNSQENCESAICYGRGHKISDHNIYKSGINIETLFHALMTRVTGFTGKFSYFSTKRMIRFIKDFNPDIVHIHELHAYYVNISKLLDYLSEKNISTVLTLHCEFSYTGKCGHSFECNQWKTECKKCPHIQNYVKSLFFDRTNQMFIEKRNSFSKFKNLTIVAPSSWIMSRVQESFLKCYPNKLIYNGIDTNVFRYIKNTETLRSKLKISKSEKVILAVAPNLMSIEKGGEYVMSLSKRCINRNIKFIFVGIKNEKIRFVDNCILLGPIYSKERLAEFYSLADAFIICSKKENFPTTCLEAQCCGTPVFGFDTGGTKETNVLDFSYFSEYGDVDALLHNMDKLLYEEKLSKENLAKKAAKVFSSKVMGQNYYQLFNEIYKKRCEEQ